MATLAEIRKQREAGVTVKQAGGVSVGEVWGKPAPDTHRRNSGIRHRSLGPDVARSVPAVSAGEHTSFELNRRRAAVLSAIQSLEWEFTKHPTKIAAAKLVLLRKQASDIEAELVEYADLI